MTYYKVLTARDIFPTYADYIKLQTAMSYVADDIPKAKATKNKTKFVPTISFLKYCMLNILHDKPFSGSEILEEIWMRTNKQWKPSQKTVYSVLVSLRKNGYVDRINRYVLTEEGKNFLEKPFSDNHKFIYHKFFRINRNKIVLDCACGIGSDIGAIKEMGFKYVVGTEISDIFIKQAQTIADSVLKCDMHLLGFRDESFDVIYSAHTLEHAYIPAKILHEFWRMLKTDGHLFIILPYPDGGPPNRENFHCAIGELGLNILDNGEALTDFFEANGFRLTIKQKSRGTVQQPIIWLQFRKQLYKRGKPYKPWEEA